MTSVNLSLWADAYGPYEANSPFRGERHVDVAVVGGGFNGLSAAWHLRRGDGAPQVVLLEADAIGDGASGRNAGILVTEFGLHVQLVKAFYGRQRTQEAIRYTTRSLDYARQLIRDHGMDSDAVDRCGTLQIAMDRRWVKDLEATKAVYDDLGFGDHHEWVDAGALAQEFNSPLLAGTAALLERDMLRLDPCKHVREWKRLAVEAGVEVHERSPVTQIAEDGGKVRLSTPLGVVVADRVVLATNAHTHQLPGDAVARGDQWPVYAYQFATEPLSDAQWAEIGWERRCYVQNGLQGFHWFVPTADGRILFGGRHFPDADAALTRDYDPAILGGLERDFRAYFPSLRDLRVTHRWGGVLSGTADLLPHIGFADDRRRFVRINGCWGHGVNMAHLNGQLVADLVSGVDSELTSLWFVNRKARRWPPGPLRSAGMRTLNGLLSGLDEWRIRGASRDAATPGARAAFAGLRAA